jgi:hypothetical protein
MKLDFPRNIFEKYISSNTKIRPVSAEFFEMDKRTDRHDEANSRCLQFFDGPLKPLARNKFKLRALPGHGGNQLLGQNLH